MDDARTFRVTLGSISFAEIDVRATSLREAFTIAERAANESKPTFTTHAIATSAKIARLVDPLDPSKGIEWVVAEQ